MTRKKRMFLFFGVQVLFIFAANFAHAVTPTMFYNLGLHNYMFGMAMAMAQIGNFLFSPFWGKLVDHISSKKVLSIGCAGYAVAQICFLLARTEAQFMAARFLAGSFFAAPFTAILTYIVNTTGDEQERGRYLTISLAIQSIFGAFGFMIGGFLGEISIYTPIFTQIATLVACTVLFSVVCRDDSAGEKFNLSEVARESNPFASFWASRAFMTPVLAALFILVAMHSLGFLAFDQSFNYYLKDQFQFSSGYNGLFKGITGFVTMAVNSTLTMWMMKKTDTRKSIVIMYGVSALCMSAAVFSPVAAVFIASNTAYYAMASTIMPMIQNLLAKTIPGKHSNLGMGFFNGMKALGSIVGSAVAGFLYNAKPILPFVFATAVFLLAIPISLYYKRASSKPAAVLPAGGADGE